MEKLAANSSIRFDSTSLGAIFDRKLERYQKSSTLLCREAKQRKKVWLSAFAAAMLCAGMTAQAATITVNNASGGSVVGACTLRDAVEAVNTAAMVNGCAAGDGSSDTIEFDTAVFSAPTTIMVSPEIGITKGLTIIGALDGSGDSLITLDGNSANRILNVTGTISLAVSGLIFQNGNPGASNGGAILAAGTVNVSNSAFVGNQAGWDGGAIHASTTNIDNSIFTGNYSTYYGGATYTSGATNVSNSAFTGNKGNYGGAIHASGSVSANNSTFTENESGYGGVLLTSGYGGAIYASVANVSDSVFDRNQAKNRYGGAIYSVNTVNVSGSTFTGNQGTDYGGAIYAGSTINVGNSVFTVNESGSGGAIYAAAANISDSVFNENRANYFGGATYTGGATNVSNSTFIGNTADSGGGAIGFGGTTFEASHLTLLDNSAGNAYDGAAIFVYTGNGSIHNSLVLSSSDLVGATALCSGAVTGSYNIEWVNGTDTTSCGGVNNVPGGSGGIGAIVATALADNGGPTPTLALPAGSPAIGAVDSSGATSQMLVIDFSQTPVTATWEDATLDQRGVARATTAAERSLGAFEYKTPPPPPLVNATPIPVLPAPLAFLLALGLAGIGLRKLKIARS
jgi:predicted outer membrane repeat protein